VDGDDNRLGANDSILSEDKSNGVNTLERQQFTFQNTVLPAMKLKSTLEVLEQLATPVFNDSTEWTLEVTVGLEWTVEITSSASLACKLTVGLSSTCTRQQLILLGSDLDVDDSTTRQQLILLVHDLDLEAWVL